MATHLCPYFGKCGGCTSQHLDYELQLKNKRDQIAKALQWGEVKVFPSPPYHYRNRLDFIFHNNGLGLRKKDNPSEIGDIKECVIAEERINLLLKEVRDFFVHPDYFNFKKQTGTYKYAVIRTNPASSSISFVLNADSSRLEQAIEKIKAFANITGASSVIIFYTAKEDQHSTGTEYTIVKGTGYLETDLLGKKFIYNSQSFFQNNLLLAEQMHSYVRGLLQQASLDQAQLLDLYGGVGTFGIINADRFRKVTIVEEFAPSITDAQENIKINKIKNTEALVLDAKKLNKLALTKPLVVIMDPPRSGPDQKVLQQLKELQPESIIYISCNIMQAAKDLKKLPYSIQSAALFDFFPQTNQSEVVIELIKKTIAK